jgi:cellulose synthase (UDP-forming)
MIKGSWADPNIAAQMKGIGLGWIWSAYNLMMLGIALLILLDVPRPSPYEWFNLRRTVKLNVVENGVEQILWGVTTILSEVGAEVALTQAGLPRLALNETLPVRLEILENQLVLHGDVVRTGVEDEFPTVRIMFGPIDLFQQRQLTELLFCRPGQWKSRCTPNEFQSLWLLCRILLKPRVLFDRQVDVSAVSVAQV